MGRACRRPHSHGRHRVGGIGHREMDQVQIQYENRTGNWTTVMVVQNLSPNIANAMKATARSNPGSRVRAIDRNRRVVDIL